MRCAGREVNIYLANCSHPRRPLLSHSMQRTRPPVPVTYCIKHSDTKDGRMAMNVEDKRAPMAAAPIKYAADGSVDWGNMWDSFCVLAREGGPPHRGQLLDAQEGADV